MFFWILFFVFYPLFTKYHYINFNDSIDDKKIYIDNLINQINDLEFEKEMGTISNDDYNFIKSTLLIEISKYIEK